MGRCRMVIRVTAVEHGDLPRFPVISAQHVVPSLGEDPAIVHGIRDDIAVLEPADRIPVIVADRAEVAATRAHTPVPLSCCAPHTR